MAALSEKDRAARGRSPRLNNTTPRSALAMASAPPMTITLSARSASLTNQAFITETATVKIATTKTASTKTIKAETINANLRTPSYWQLRHSS